eukprot:365800-Chlamydomonas_euryale.AAC.29
MSCQGLPQTVGQKANGHPAQIRAFTTLCPLHPLAALSRRGLPPHPPPPPRQAQCVQCNCDGTSMNPCNCPARCRKASEQPPASVDASLCTTPHTHATPWRAGGHGDGGAQGGGHSARDAAPDAGLPAHEEGGSGACVAVGALAGPNLL